MKKQVARQPRRSWFWLQGATVGIIAAAAPATAMLTLALLCPAIAFYAGEPPGNRPVSRTMLLTGSTAVVLPLRTLWEQGNTIAIAFDLLADPTCPLLAWIACGVGWLLCELATLTTSLALSFQIRRTMQALHREETELKSEWTLP